MTLPSNVGTGLVTGRFIRVVADGGDEDRDPDALPLSGMSIRFTPSVARFRNVAMTPPSTIVAEAVTASTDEDGVLIGPDSEPGVRLVATDDPDLDPTNFTYQVTISGTGIATFSFNIAVPEGEEVDLTTVVPVPASPAQALPEWQAAVNTVIEARDATLAARDEILDGGGGTIGGDGKSAYQIALDNGFSGTEAEWLTSLEGADGEDGTDGREVQLQTSATHIQWRYVGGTWADLVTLDSLKGEDGAPGAPGADGEEGAPGAPGADGEDGTPGECRRRARACRPTSSSTSRPRGPGPTTRTSRT